ncbi:MAG TPA: hypothetical protein DCM05_05965 [Elusimicrobia bacterium]|nr:hypothetical protein [Elusimicrobiota bacterium]
MKKVLIVKCSALGDVLRTTSLLPPLKRLGPCRVHWLTSPQARPLLRGNPHLESVWILGRPLPRDFDLVLSLEESEAAARAAEGACRGEFLGVRPGLGYTPSSAPYYDMSLLRRDPDGGRQRADALKKANRLTYSDLWLHILGSTGPAPRPVLRLSPAEKARARRFARKHGFLPGTAVGFNPGAGRRWPSKQLSVEASVRLLQALAGLGRPVLLFGGAGEKARNRRILASVGEARVLAPGPRPLREFAALVGLCGALVTTDTLALHVAAALGRGLVALVGPTSAAELDVYGRGAVLTPPRGCACFYRPRCAARTHCLSSIPPERVVSEVRRLLR